jgi:hypothetical protein
MAAFEPPVARIHQWGSQSSAMDWKQRSTVHCDSSPSLKFRPDRHHRQSWRAFGEIGGSASKAG